MKFANLLLLFEKYDWSRKVFSSQSMSTYCNHCITSKKAYSVVQVAWILEIILILVYLIVGLDRVEKIKDTNCCCKVVSWNKLNLIL